MKTTLSKLDQLHAAINFEREHYKNAIINDQPFEQVKVIYVKIKSLEKEADELMQQANAKLMKKPMTIEDIARVSDYATPQNRGNYKKNEEISK